MEPPRGAAQICAGRGRHAVRGVRGRDRRGRSAAGRGLRCCCGHRDFARHVVDCGGHADHRGAGAHRHPCRARGAVDPAVSGPDGGAGAVHGRLSRQRRQLACGARLDHCNGRRPAGRHRRRRPLRAWRGVSSRRADRQPRADHGDLAPGADRLLDPHRARRSVGGAWRVSGGPAAVGDGIPPPGRDRPVAVQGAAGRAVLHQRRHDASIWRSCSNGCRRSLRWPPR